MDFDAWAALAKRDPEAFETLRTQALEEAIGRAADPERQERLRRLQWRIDMVRTRAGTPLAACINLYNMMWDSVLRPRGMLDGMRQLCAGQPPTPQRARILAFPDPDRRA